MDQLKISAKALGDLRKENACKRCFWLKLHHLKPGTFEFPGVFQHIDTYTKNVTTAFYEQHGSLPPWFGFDGKPVPVPPLKAFSTLDQETNILLNGIPDEIIRVDDGYAIVDYKTSKSQGHDKYLPVYEVQLNGYAYIAERMATSLMPVTKLLLLYYEPQTTVENLDGALTSNGFLMGFKGSTTPIALQPTLVPSLLAQAREVYEQQQPPNPHEKCRECKTLNELVKSLRITM